MKNKQRLISAMLASVIAAGTIGCGSGNSENATATESAPDIVSTVAAVGVLRRQVRAWKIELIGIHFFSV